MKKANPFSGSFLFPMPAHRIRICPKDGFGFRPPPFHYRAPARDRFSPRSSNLSSHSSICANLFREPNELIQKRTRFCETIRSGKRIRKTSAVFRAQGSVWEGMRAEFSAGIFWAGKKKNKKSNSKLSRLFLFLVVVQV